MNKKISIKEIKKVRDISVLPINFRPMAKISPYISYFFIKYLPFNPNQISLIWGFIGLVAVFLIALGSYWNMLAGVLVYHLALLLDYVDGEVARVSKKTSLVGIYLDKIFSIVFRGLLILGLGIGLYNTNGNVLYFYLGVWACLFLVFDNLNKLKMYEAFIEKGKFDLLKKYCEKITGVPKFEGNLIYKLKFYTKNLLVPIHPFSFLLFSIIFNVSQYYLILIAIISPLVFIKNFVDIYRKLGEIS